MQDGTLHPQGDSPQGTRTAFSLPTHTELANVSLLKEVTLIQKAFFRPLTPHPSSL